ncbi:hypothetical protein [Nostoc favosum]|uniref:Lipoprotein n=1 Tax=Nostoc favosum CHAB5714 TaxID=2780399 RepID=A0ABS8IFJ3_9NOSO|nr:hypothetical protein [Nostoc favosum]MCC5602227.1 hypothetical protein [Nostoc favosum CHAB5714]
MSRKQLVLGCAIATFAFSATLSGCILTFGQKKPNYLSITIPVNYAKLAFGLGLAGTGLTVFLANRIEVVERRELPKPVLIPTPCQGCRYFHGYIYNGVIFNCAVHPQGWLLEQCPDWQGYQKLTTRSKTYDDDSN